MEEKALLSAKQNSKDNSKMEEEEAPVDDVQTVMEELNSFFDLAGGIASENESLEREVAEEKRKVTSQKARLGQVNSANVELHESLAAAHATIMRLRENEKRFASAITSEISLRADLQTANQETRVAVGETQRLQKRCAALEAREKELEAKCREMAHEKRQVELRARRMLRSDRYSSST